MAPHVVIVHYAEGVPIDPGFTASRYSATARSLVLRGATVTRLYPSFSHGTRAQRGGPVDWHDEELGRFQAVATPSYGRSMGVERVKFLRAFVMRSVKVVSDLDPDVVLVGHPPPGLVSMIVRRMQRPRPRVIADVRDLWPDAQLSSQRGVRRVVVRAVEPIVRRMTRDDLSRADGVVAISRDYLRWAESQAGRRWPKRNRAVIPLGANLLDGPGEPGSVGARRRGVVFVGSLSDHFDFNLLIAGWQRLVDRRPELAEAHPLTIVGGGDRLGEVRALGAAVNWVNVVGRRPHEEAMRLVAGHLVGVAPYVGDASMGLPNKIFEYMTGGVAVLSTLHGEVEYLLASNEAGLTISEHTPENLADTLIRLLDDPDKTAQLGERGRAVAVERFDRERLATDLADFLLRQAATLGAEGGRLVSGPCTG